MADWLQFVPEMTGYEYDPSSLEHRFGLPWYPISLNDIVFTPPQAADVPYLSRSIAYQLSAALAFLHGRGVAHRDISPSNIMFDWDGTLKLIDYGIAWSDYDRYKVLAFSIGPKQDGQPFESREEGTMICQVGTGCVGRDLVAIVHAETVV